MYSLNYQTSGRPFLFCFSRPPCQTAFLCCFLCITLTQFRLLHLERSWYSVSTWISNTVDVEQRYKRVEGFEELYHRVVSTVKIGLFIVTINFDGRVYWNNIARVIFFPDSPPYKGSIPSFFPTSENEKKKGLKIKTLFSFRGTDVWINPNMWRD